MVPDPVKDFPHFWAKQFFFGHGQQINEIRANWRFQIFAAIIPKFLVNVRNISVLTTISPLSLVDRVQRTPQLVVIGCGTGMVFYSFVSERYPAAFASRCLLDTSSPCKGYFKNNGKVTVYNF